MLERWRKPWPWGDLCEKREAAPARRLKPAGSFCFPKPDGASSIGFGLRALTLSSQHKRIISVRLIYLMMRSLLHVQLTRL
jgi:hypothetical protein